VNGKNAGTSHLLASAHIGIDPVHERGRVSRGAYIVDYTGTQYLTHSGEWTAGIKGDDNWWNNWADAADFLRNMKANAGANASATERRR
jgi:hypothetical protein